MEAASARKAGKLEQRIRPRYIVTCLLHSCTWVAFEQRSGQNIFPSEWLLWQWDVDTSSVDLETSFLPNFLLCTWIGSCADARNLSIPFSETLRTEKEKNMLLLKHNSMRITSGFTCRQKELTMFSASQWIWAKAKKTATCSWLPARSGTHSLTCSRRLFAF